MGVQETADLILACISGISEKDHGALSVNYTDFSFCGIVACCQEVSQMKNQGNLQFYCPV